MATHTVLHSMLEDLEKCAKSNPGSKVTSKDDALARELRFCVVTVPEGELHGFSISLSHYKGTRYRMLRNPALNTSESRILYAKELEKASLGEELLNSGAVPTLWDRLLAD